MKSGKKWKKNKIKSEFLRHAKLKTGPGIISTTICNAILPSRFYAKSLAYIILFSKQSRGIATTTIFVFYLFFKMLLEYSCSTMLSQFLPCIHSAVSGSFPTPRTIACQGLLPMGFSKQEYWSGCHALLQSFCCPAKWISCADTYSPLSWIAFPSRSPQSAD